MSNKENVAGVLTYETLEQVAKIIYEEAFAQRECQFQKIALTDFCKDFCSIVAYKRLDRGGKGFLNSLDLVEFFRDNGKIIPEADTYMLINAFDSNNDGKLSLLDFQKMVCPYTYTISENLKATKKQFQYAIENSEIQLSHNVEHGILRIFEREIESVKKVEPLKQTLINKEDFSMLEIFRAIDQYAHGTINLDNLRVFFRQFEFCSDLDEQDVVNWLKKYDRDANLQLGYADLVTALGPFCQFKQKAKIIQNLKFQHLPDGTLQLEQEGQETDGRLNQDDQPMGSIATKAAIREQQQITNRPASQRQKSKNQYSTQQLPIKRPLSKSGMNSNRALSRMTKTTAASVNNTMLNDKRNQSNIFGSPNKTNFSHLAKSELPPRKTPLINIRSKGVYTQSEAAEKLVRPDSFFQNKSAQLQNGGDILNYPYQFERKSHGDNDVNALQNQLRKMNMEERYRLAEIQNAHLFSPVKEDFTGALPFSKALLEMTEIEGELEKKRRELVLRSDFNLCDVFKMFGGLSRGKRGVDVDDLYGTITSNLNMTITKDEVFIMFYKLSKNGDSLINYNEFSDCFTPRSKEYAVILNSRGGFYGKESDFTKFFEGPTRELLKIFIKGFIDCEVAIELVRQRIHSNIRLNHHKAFAQIDKLNRGTIICEDLRQFMKQTNLYPVDKNLQLLFERFDPVGDGHSKFEDFKHALTPFMNNELI